MRKASFVEAVLARLTSRKRAAAIVGDLFEIEAREMKPFEFWFSFARIALSFMWRPFLAFVAALYIGLWLFGEFVMAADSTQARYYPPHAWEPLFGPLIFIGSMSWAAALYLIVCYSPKDKTAQLVFAWACIASAVILFWWQPITLWTCGALALFLVGLSILGRSFRRAGLVVLISLLLGVVLRFTACMVAAYYQYYLGRHLGIHWGSKEVQDHPSICWVYEMAAILTFWITTAAWSRLHHWAARGVSRGAREGGVVVGE